MSVPVKKIAFVSSALAAAYVMSMVDLTTRGSMQSAAQAQEKSAPETFKPRVSSTVLRGRVAQLSVDCQPGTQRIEVAFSKGKHFLCSFIGSNDRKDWITMHGNLEKTPFCRAIHMEDKLETTIKEVCVAGEPRDGVLDSLQTKLRKAISIPSRFRPARGHSAS